MGGWVFRRFWSYIHVKRVLLLHTRFEVLPCRNQSDYVSDHNLRNEGEFKIDSLKKTEHI